MNRSHSDAEDVMIMDTYFETSHKIKDLEGRDIRKIKMLMGSPKPKTRNDKKERPRDQILTKECKPRIGMRFSKNIRQLAKNSNKQSRIR